MSLLSSNFTPPDLSMIDYLESLGFQCIPKSTVYECFYTWKSETVGVIRVFPVLKNFYGATYVHFYHTRDWDDKNLTLNPHRELVVRSIKELSECIQNYVFNLGFKLSS